ncbi:RING-H2 finger protein ATL79-like [Lolium perenne]|uniref:RING-H2 finger protein ATL79-like n=1 Tax=Lolium perenne TaxID=4522 RepID=UPI0021E9FA3D|nr:RING-H2 finger protein ATL79-like [Lolium perenne]
MQLSSSPPRHSRMLLPMAPTASPSPAPAAPGISTPYAWPPAVASPDAESALAWPNTNAILVLALLVCALFCAIVIHVVLQCAFRVASRAWYGPYGAIGTPQEPAPRAGGGGGGGDSRKRGALPCLAYSAGLDLAGSSRAECAICLAEFARGEQLRVLPRCNHGFHAHCIDRWLDARPTCPTCRQAPFAEPDVECVLAAGRARPEPVVAVVRVIVDGGRARRVEI